MSIGPDGKWSGLTVPRKRAQIAFAALRKIAGGGGYHAVLARQALRDAASVREQSPKEKG